ncbi:photosystem II protein PsbQ [Lyngbya aestuarii]|uniref:photosystem II protein PsbQ n=1 Tax=Lyngbya aestuarii TaxID=118322 RepID=UPI00403DD6A7
MVMKRYRSILALILALVATFLVSCSGPTVTQPPTYTAEQIEQIKKSASPLMEIREKMPILQTNIRNKNWNDVGTFIHGPLGDLRRNTSYITRQLLPGEQKTAKATAKDLFDCLEKIGLAADEGNYQVAIQNYGVALQDFDKFLQLLPR